MLESRHKSGDTKPLTISQNVQIHLTTQKFCVSETSKFLQIFMLAL